MTLTTHALIGAAVSQILPGGPLVAFAGGVVSHLLADAIPHGHYRLTSLEKDEKNPMGHKLAIFSKDFLFDLSKITSDFMLVFAGVFLVASLGLVELSVSLWLAVIGALLPDFLQFFYHLWPHEPLKTIQKIHLVVFHTRREILKPLPIILNQAAVVLIIFFVVRFLT